MKMVAFDAFELEGEPQEIGTVIFLLLELIHRKDEQDKEDAVHREMELLEKYANMTFEELMKKEREEENGDE